MRLVLPALGLFVSTSLYAFVVQREGAVEAGTARKMDVAAMVDAADLVLEGEVLAARSLLGARDLIETEFVLRVDRTFWGEHLPERTVRLPGGVLEDGRGLLLAGMPRLVPGEEVLLFLTGKSASGVRMPVGLAQGKFGLERLENGELRLVREHAGLELAHPATGAIEDAPPRAVFGYADVVGEIFAAAAARRARALSGDAGQDR